MRLANKVSIITGAGAGMGYAAAHLFAREGSKVAVVDLRRSGRPGRRRVSSRGGRRRRVLPLRCRRPRQRRSDDERCGRPLRQARRALQQRREQPWRLRPDPHPRYRRFRPGHAHQHQGNVSLQQVRDPASPGERGRLGDQCRLGRRPGRLGRRRRAVYGEGRHRTHDEGGGARLCTAKHQGQLPVPRLDPHGAD